MSGVMRPIVVLGAARSGTKFLRDALASSPEAAVVPYDVNFIWRSGNEGAPHDALAPELCTPSVSQVIRERLRQVAGVSGREPRRIVEKTVSNTLRVPFVARVLPDADFVHIVRDGRPVVESSIRQWQAPTDWRHVLRKARSFPLANYRYGIWYLVNRLRGARGRSIWGVRYPGIDEDLARHSVAEICAQQWVHSIDGVLASAPALSRYRQVRYEDLITDEGVFADLVRWLGLPGLDGMMRSYRSKLAPPPRGRWDAGMAPADADAVLRIISPNLARLGYH